MADALYNEIDGYAAEWIGNLAAEGHIAPGRVDTRSILDVRPSDLDGVRQFHAFAGVAGWSLALRLAGIPDDFPVWTGSCPCQPFSAAGRRAGFDDDRHLWPVWFRLIRKCRPAIVFGEQVEAAVRLGWLDAVFADLEGEGYACAATVLGAHSVGAPHIRQRLWFVAYACGQRLDGQSARLWWPGAAGRDAADHPEAAGGREAIRVADAADTRYGWSEDPGSDRGYPHALQSGGQGFAGLCEPQRGGASRFMGDAGAPGLPDVERQELSGARRRGEGRATEQSGCAPWANLEWLPCRDGKARPTQPGLQPLAHGVSARVGKLRAAGNAIVPQVAAAFIAAALAALPPSNAGA